MVNNWLSKSVIPRESVKHGKGVFAVKDITKNGVIAVFGGHVLTRKERDALPKSIRYLALGIDDDLFIGPVSTKETDDADWVNHSCDPNAGINGQIMLVAIRNIKKGEEITFDYVMSCSQKGEKRVLFSCNCTSPNCRKEITNHDWKNQGLQEKYKGYFSFFVQRNIDKLNQ